MAAGQAAGKTGRANTAHYTQLTHDTLTHNALDRDFSLWLNSDATQGVFQHQYFVNFVENRMIFVMWSGHMEKRERGSY